MSFSASSPGPPPSPEPPTGAGTSPLDVAIDALNNVAEDPILNEIESGAVPLPFGSDLAGFADHSSDADPDYRNPASLPINPYTNIVTTGGLLYAFVGQDVNPYTNVSSISENANVLTLGQKGNPYIWSTDTPDKNTPPQDRNGIDILELGKYVYQQITAPSPQPTQPTKPPTL